MVKITVSTNQAILKKYGDSFYKITCFKSSNRFLPKKPSQLPPEQKPKKGTLNEKKLRENISRARAKVFELVTCNTWTYWSTFTLDKTKYTRSDLVKFQSDFSQWIRNQSKKHKCKIDYILVPELHKDRQNWHMHGFIQGLPFTELELFTKENAPRNLQRKIRNGDLIYNWLAYGEKFGFNDLELIRNQEACSKYISKYFTKELSKSVGKLNAHMFYASKGLSKALEIKRGTIVKQIVPSYENEYVRVSVVPAKDITQTEMEGYIESISDNVLVPKIKRVFREFNNEQYLKDVAFYGAINGINLGGFFNAVK